jgi:S1-C subfamily serine protease
MGIHRRPTHRPQASIMYQPSKKMVPAVALTGLISAVLGLEHLRTNDNDPLVLAQSISSAYQQLAEEVGPAVVQVKTYGTVRSRRRSLQEGSGVIIDSDGKAGTVVTNYHVIKGGDQFRVCLTDGRVLEATEVGHDEDTDLAVLSIKAEQLTTASLAPEAEAKVGEIVLAMGNPMGLGHTVTSGIVSGIGRSDLNIAFYEDFIQTDAAINMGNSGGPLINLNGQVLGINTAVAITNDDNGLAFAIPSRMVRRSVEDILRYGEVKRGYLGVENHSSWRAGSLVDAARNKGFEGVSRIAISRVSPDSPAERGGLAVNDIILTINGVRISDQRSFRTAIADVAPGDRTTVEVWRSGERLKLPVVVTGRE